MWAPDPDGLYCVFVRDRQTLVARYEGSFFAVRAAVESTVAEDEPDPLLIYVPGVARDQNDSVLMELEKGGTRYEPQLKRHARTLLRRFYTDGEIDDMLAPEASDLRRRRRLPRAGEYRRSGLDPQDDLRRRVERAPPHALARRRLARRRDRRQAGAPRAAPPDRGAARVVIGRR